VPRALRVGVMHGEDFFGLGGDKGVRPYRRRLVGSTDIAWGAGCRISVVRLSGLGIVRVDALIIKISECQRLREGMGI
jgi:hypothetical protein